MTRSLRVLFVAILVLAPVVAAGCGDTARNNEYVEAVNQAQTDFADNISSLSGAATTPEEASAIFERLQDGVENVVADLRAVDPPASVKALHDELVAQIAKFKDAIGKAAKAVDSGNPTRIAKAQAAFATDVAAVGTKIGATIDRINAELRD